MPTPAPAPAPRRQWVLPALLSVVLGAAGVTAFFLWPKLPPPVPPDMEAATDHNARGVELMDQLKFTEAREEFAAAVSAAPDWVPARINYGVASFNEQQPDAIELDPRVRKAQQVFEDLLTHDPDNKHAHYCLGMIALYVGHDTEAYPHFQRVSELDPGDAHTWLRVGTTHPSGRESAEAAECYEKALKLDPLLNEARYRLMRAVIDKDPERAQDLMAEHARLQETDQVTPSRIVFGEMGKYGDVIGRDPSKPGQPGGDPPGIRKPLAW